MCRVIDIAVLQNRRRLMDAYTALMDNKKPLATSALAGVLAQNMPPAECARLILFDFDGLLRLAAKTKNPERVYHQTLTILAGIQAQ